MVPHQPMHGECHKVKAVAADPERAGVHVGPVPQPQPLVPELQLKGPKVGVHGDVERVFPRLVQVLELPHALPHMDEAHVEPNLPLELPDLQLFLQHFLALYNTQ